MKILPRKLSVKRAQCRTKNSFHVRSAHMFTLKLLLITILSSFFHTFNNLFYTFSTQTIAFFVPKDCTGISSPYPASFSNDFTFDGGVRKSRKRLKIFTQVLWDMPNHYSHRILVMFVAIFTF